MPQKTLNGSVICTGVSLHAGTQVSMEFKPAPADTGIVFHVHGEEGVRQLALCPEAVSTTELATTISDGVVSVSTIEHVLSSLRALDIDNVEIHVVGCEVPLLDGSAKLIIEALDKAGIKELDTPRKMQRVTREYSLEQNGKSIAVAPYEGFRVDYTIRFPHPVIGEQRFVLDITPESFREHIANARTFGFFREAEYLRSRGLARGCSLDNVIVLDDNGVMNEGGLRFSDEFVRHKILDFIGDMAMLGKPMLGSFTVSCSGHAHNNAFLRQLVQLEGALEDVER